MRDSWRLGPAGFLGQEGDMNCVWLGYDTEGHEAGEGAVGAAGGRTIHRHGQMTLSMSGRSSEGKSRSALRGTWQALSHHALHLAWEIQVLPLQLFNPGAGYRLPGPARCSVRTTVLLILLTIPYIVRFSSTPFLCLTALTHRMCCSGSPLHKPGVTLELNSNKQRFDCLL